jgi:formylmethanofuran dehydrogenase subunit E
MEEMLRLIADPEMRVQVEKVVPFHGYLSTGAFIGIQMFNIARRELDIHEGERIFVTCETYNCLPDPFQILAGATIGNKGLTIKDHGKMAATIVKRGEFGKTTKAVRIMLDPAKTAQYPRLHAWFMKTCKVPHPEAVSILIEAGENIYSWEVFEIEVPERAKKLIAICEGCGESFIKREDEAFCQACLENLATEDVRLGCSNPEDERCPQS